MFIVSLTYIAPLSDIDAQLDAHIAYLEHQYQQGIFLASGRKVPRTGGVILARCSTRQQLDDVLQQDPFAIAGVAEYTVTECHISKTASQLEDLLD